MFIAQNVPVLFISMSCFTFLLNLINYKYQNKRPELLENHSNAYIKEESGQSLTTTFEEIWDLPIIVLKVQDTQLVPVNGNHLLSHLLNFLFSSLSF